MKLLWKFTIYFFLIFIILTAVLIIKNVPAEILFLCIISFLLIYTAAIFFLNREIIRPLRSYTDFSANISRYEDEPSDNNFSSKIRDLNEILFLVQRSVRQKHHTREINSLYTSLEDITGRIITELETAKLFKINRNEFLGNVAHELRTPIFAIQLSIETLTDGAINDDKVNMDFLNRALKQAERLKELVDDLITISNIETGMKMSKRYFALNDFIRGIVNELKGLADKKRINLTFVPSVPVETQVFGDSERLKQVLVNLIENSIKYTPEEGTVNILITDEGSKEIKVTIEDTGIGIPKKDIPRIFERFYRVDKNRSRDRGGSGLGLSIVKHILEAHGSKILVESEVDKGSKFTFNLQK